MALIEYTAEVKGDLLLELPIEAEALHLRPGDKVRVRVDLALGGDIPIQPNEGMLAALREIAERQQGRRPTDGSDTDRVLREGRAGAMWGSEPIE
jgi:hypothetical protein